MQSGVDVIGGEGCRGERHEEVERIKESIIVRIQFNLMSAVHVNRKHEY